MNHYDYLHEAEDVWVIPGRTLECSDLWELMPTLGFELDEDLFTVDRKGKLPLWQSRSAVSVYVLLGEEEVYDEEGKWDRLKLRYLLATLPAELIPFFIDKAAAVAAALHAPLVYRGRPVTAAELMGALEECASELRVSLGEPGSRDVAVAVKATYPRV